MGLVLGSKDWWSWKGNVPPDFSMKSPYSHWRVESKGEFSYFYNLFWNCKVLPVAQVLTWRVLQNKIATQYYLLFVWGTRGIYESFVLRFQNFLVSLEPVSLVVRFGVGCSH